MNFSKVFSFLMFRRFSIPFDVANVISEKSEKNCIFHSCETSGWIGMVWNCESKCRSHPSTEWHHRRRLLFNCWMKTFSLMTDINFHNRRIISKLAGDDGEFQLKMEVDAIKWLSGVTSSHLQCASSHRAEHLMTILMCFCWFFWVIKHNCSRKQWKYINFYLLLYSTTRRSRFYHCTDWIWWNI